MKKHRRKHQDPNQLMLFSDEEMSGLSVSEEHETEFPSQETDTQPLLVSEKETLKETADQIPTSPRQVMESSESVVSLLKDVMGILDRFSDNQVRLIAMQTAALVQGGIDYSQTYRIPAISDFEFRGNVLAGLAYVSIARSFPNMTESIGLHWSEEYREAEALYLNS